MPSNPTFTATRAHRPTTIGFGVVLFECCLALKKNDPSDGLFTVFHVTEENVMSSDSVSVSGKVCTKAQLSAAIGNLRRILDPAVKQLKKGSSAWVQNDNWYVQAVRSKEKRRIVAFKITQQAWMPTGKPDNAATLYSFEAEYKATYLTQESLRAALLDEGSVGLLELLMK